MGKRKWTIVFENSHAKSLSWASSLLWFGDLAHSLRMEKTFLWLSHLLSPIFHSKLTLHCLKVKGLMKNWHLAAVSSERQSIDFQNWTEKWRLSNKHTRRARNIWTKVTITCHWFPLKGPALLERHCGLETILFERNIIIELGAKYLAFVSSRSVKMRKT